MSKYYFQAPLLDYNQDELLDCYQGLEKNWTHYGRPGSHTLWALNWDIAEFRRTHTGRQFNLSYVESVAFFRTLGGGSVAAHRDTRPTSFLIPIAGDFEASSVDFFDEYQRAVVVKSKNNSGSFASETTLYQVGEPSFTLYYNQPTCINSNIIHRVNNPSPADRLVLSITFDQALSFEAVHMLYMIGDLFIHDEKFFL